MVREYKRDLYRFGLGALSKKQRTATPMLPKKCIVVSACEAVWHLTVWHLSCAVLEVFLSDSEVACMERRA